MKKNHTSGPWERSGCTIYAGEIMLACTYCEENRHLHTIEADDAIPDSTGIHGNGLDEAWANARLIAAAPELLDALKTLIEGIEHLDIHGAGYARQVVAKAEGRGE
jgi:hypothetical protein